MNEKVIKPGVTKRMVDLLKSANTPYTQEDVENVMAAFWDVICESIEDGDTIKLNGYMSIELKHMAEHKLRNVVSNQEMTVPELYRVNFRAGSRLKEAAKAYTKRQLGGKNE